MARYIDANKIRYCWMYDADGTEHDGVTLQSIVEKTPTADVVEVVRCKDCIHCTIHNSPTLFAYCEKTHFRFEPFQTDTRTHFCSYGERKPQTER